MDTKKQQAVLVLEDGSCFVGWSFGAQKAVSGEVVFNTGMVGYPEGLTDPSYHGQILMLTYPLIGNYGVPGDTKQDGLFRFFESDRIQVEGLVVSEYSHQYSHWNATRSLSKWMKQYNIPGITGIDTRALTKKIRIKGTLAGKIVYDSEDVDFEDVNKRNLASEVSIAEPHKYGVGDKQVVLVDCGTKHNIIRAFLSRGFSVLRVPWDYDFLKEEAAGVIVSNGPGNPKKCTTTIKHVRRAMDEHIPLLGICLGSQILGLAAEANTYKLKYGHRSHNQPCMETGTRRCYITSQNHGYAIDAETLPQDWREWFCNHNDGTNEGIMHLSKPFFGAQFHPEASPGPDDTEFLFDMFVRAMR